MRSDTHLDPDLQQTPPAALRGCRVPRGQVFTRARHWLSQDCPQPSARSIRGHPGDLPQPHAGRGCLLTR